jgi:alpha-beta hydrolase superfamily lysophospholipase
MTLRRSLLLAAAGGALLAAASALLAEVGLRVRNRRPPVSADAEAVVSGTGARWQSEQVQGADGVTLQAWLFTPAQPNGGAVLVLHGNGARRDSMMPHVRYLLAAGYTVLTPDSRAHGASGGDIETYGLREAADARGWLDLLASLHGNRRLYGLGESLGAVILIEALPREKRLRAVVADCPFATFEEAAYNRLAQRLYLPRPAAWAPLQLGLVYSRAVYGVDLRQVSPIAAIRRSVTPVLLIHGTEDNATPPFHSRHLREANPGATELWEVPGAGHTQSRALRPDEYRRRVIAWFRGHP